MSPNPSIEKCPLLFDGKTNFPGRWSFGGSFITPPRFNFLATIDTGFSADLVATLTITFVLLGRIYNYENVILRLVVTHLKIYDEKNTQKTSYMRRPMSKSVDTFKLGKRTNAMNATHSAIPIASMSSQ